MKINIPNFIVPAAGVPVGQPRPLQICPSCRYVLSNAGSCENILCALDGGGSSSDTSESVNQLKYYSNCGLCRKSCTGH